MLSNSNRKMKVDKSNIIGASNPEPGTRPGRVRAGANITIIKASNASNASLPSSPGSQAGFSISRGMSPITSISTSSRTSRSNFSELGTRTQGALSPNGPFILASAMGRRTSRSSNPLPENSYPRVPNSFSPPLVQTSLSTAAQPLPNFEPDPLSEDDSDSEPVYDSPAVSEISQSSVSSYRSEHSSAPSSHSGASSLGSDISSSYAVEARVNRKILDLEISNKSLLAINQILESKVHKQRSELDGLKKGFMKLQTNNSSVEPSSLKSEEDSASTDSDDCEQQFSRIISRFDALIAEGRQALEYKPPVTGGRVLPPTSL